MHRRDLKGKKMGDVRDDSEAQREEGRQKLPSEALGRDDERKGEKKEQLDRAASEADQKAEDGDPQK
jgi:hypothetical protein